MTRSVFVATRFLLQLLMVIFVFALVDIAAFQPIALVGRTRSFFAVPGKQEYGLSSANASSNSRNLALQFAEQNDHPETLPLQQNNSQEDKSSSSSSNDDQVDALLALLDSVPSNLPTSQSLTDKILDAVQNLEKVCPTSEDLVLSELSGNWELLWTAQDRSSEQYKKGGIRNRIINPLENQSYSNNPFRGNTSWLFGGEEGGGRANPVLPRELQDVLERTGILEAAGGTKLAPIRSSQGIDIRRQRVRNVVNVQFKRPFSIKGSLLVDVNFKPNLQDKRRVDVKFDSCRLIFQNAKINRTFPLGIFGPTGWLRTGYVDDRIRITRGHKGSVFILSRTAKRRSV